MAVDLLVERLTNRGSCTQGFLLGTRRNFGRFGPALARAARGVGCLPQAVAPASEVLMRAAHPAAGEESGQASPVQLRPPPLLAYSADTGTCHLFWEAMVAHASCTCSAILMKARSDSNSSNHADAGSINAAGTLAAAPQRLPHGATSLGQCLLLPRLGHLSCIPITGSYL